MYSIQPIIDHIVNTYDFEITPCSIPRSEFQYLKRNFYIFILRNVSEKLFYFLRDKVSPIKYLDERLDNSIWLNKRGSDGKILYEMELTPEDEMFHSFIASSPNTYKVRILGNDENIEFKYTFKDFIDIDDYLIESRYFKQVLRQKKLERLL